MPQVPIETPQMSLGVPLEQGADIGLAGRPGAAIAQFGSQAAQVGTQIFDQVMTGDALNASANAAAKDKEWAAARSAQLKLESPDGNMKDEFGDNVLRPDGKPKTIVDTFKEEYNDRFQTNYDKMPNGLGQKVYHSSALPQFVDHTISLEHDQFKMKKQAWDSDFDERILSRANSPDTVPQLKPLGIPYRDEYEYDASGFYIGLKQSVKEYLDGVGEIHNGAEAPEVFRKIGYKQTEGAALQQLDTLDKARLTETSAARVPKILKTLEFWRGEDPQSKALAARGLPTFNSTADPAKLKQWIHQAEGMLKSADDADFTDLKRMVKDAGKTSQEDGFRVIREVYAAAKSHPKKYKPYEAMQDVAEVLANMADVPMSAPGVRRLPLETRVEMAHAASKGIADSVIEAGVKNFGLPLGNEAATAATQELAKRQIQRANDDQGRMKTDFAKFVAESADMTGETASRLKSLDYSKPNEVNRMKGTVQAMMTDAKTVAMTTKVNPDYVAPGTLDVEHTTILGKRFTSSDTAQGGTTQDQISREFPMWADTFGEHFPSVLNHLEKKGELPKGWGFILSTNAYNNDPDSLGNIFKGLREGELTDAQFKQNTELARKLETKVTKESRAAFRPLADAWLQSNPNSVETDQAVLNIYKLGETLVKDKINKVQGREDIDVSAAAKEAAHQVFGKHVTTGAVYHPGFIFDGAQVGSIAVPNIVNNKYLSKEDHATILWNLSNKFNQPEFLATQNVFIPKATDGTSKYANDFLPFVGGIVSPSFVNAEKTGFVMGFRGNDGVGEARLLYTQENGHFVPYVLPFDLVKNTPVPPGVFEQMARKNNPNAVTSGTGNGGSDWLRLGGMEEPLFTAPWYPGKPKEKPVSKEPIRVVPSSERAGKEPLPPPDQQYNAPPVKQQSKEPLPPADQQYNAPPDQSPESTYHPTRTGLPPKGYKEVPAKTEAELADLAKAEKAARQGDAEAKLISLGIDPKKAAHLSEAERSRVLHMIGSSPGQPDIPEKAKGVKTLKDLRAEAPASREESLNRVRKEQGLPPLTHEEFLALERAEQGLSPRPKKGKK